VGEPNIDYDLYRDLDGKVVEVGGEEWRVDLYAVRMIEGRQWVQLQLVGESTFTMTLRLPWTADEIDVLLIVADWLAQTDDHRDSVVSVGRIDGARACDSAPAETLVN
jgi:hypothetical protein